MLERQAQKVLVLLDEVVVVDSPARHREDNVVVANRFWMPGGSRSIVFAIAMQSVGHLFAGFCILRIFRRVPTAKAQIGLSSIGGISFLLKHLAKHIVSR